MKPPANYNYCPQCGSELIHVLVMSAIRPSCPLCGFIYFADPKVSVLVFVEKMGKLLLVKRRREPERGRWSLPSGFVDFGEDPSEAAIREVKEETSLEITIDKLLGVYSPEDACGIHPTILLVYIGNIVGGDLSAQDDAEEARFFSPDEIPYEALAFSNTKSMLEDWFNKRF